MCGIFGITGQKNDAKEQVFEGLKKLEYRGYDSWGIAVISNKKVKIEKKTGKISEAILSNEKSSEALGHTRWATHGRVVSRNSHPHKVGKIILVHNGIFENYLDYKKKAIKKGIKFYSETDSEVLAYLVNFYYSKTKDTKKAILKLVKKVKGRYSFLFVVEGEEGIWAVRKGSPLILGLKKNITYIASDIPAFLEKTNKVNYLEDGEGVFIKAGKRVFFDLSNGKDISKKQVTINIGSKNAEKGKYTHFMLKEIFEQKKTLTWALNQEKKKIDEFKQIVKKAKDIYLLGSGTAHKVALLGEYLFAKKIKKIVKSVSSSEMIFFKDLVKKDDLIIAISQSGETADILEVTKDLAGKKAKLVSICNTEASSLVAESDLYFLLNSGLEVAVASTKATTSQILILNLLLSEDSENTKKIFYHEIKKTSPLFLPEYQKKVLEIVEFLKKQQNIFIIGRGKFFPIALEFAIKIQEVSYINAQAFASGELKHGPIAMIEKNTPVIVLGDDPESISNAMETKTRGAKIIGISEKKNSDVFDYWLKVPSVEYLPEIITLIPCQLISYYLAIAKELNPDKPRNLAKSVTVK